MARALSNLVSDLKPWLLDITESSEVLDAVQNMAAALESDERVRYAFVAPSDGSNSMPTLEVLAMTTRRLLWAVPRAKSASGPSVWWKDWTDLSEARYVAGLSANDREEWHLVTDTKDDGMWLTLLVSDSFDERYVKTLVLLLNEYIQNPGRLAMLLPPVAPTSVPRAAPAAPTSAAPTSAAPTSAAPTSAAPAPASAAAQVPAPLPQDIAGGLEQLARLRNSGALSEDQFSAAKRKLLDL